MLVTVPKDKIEIKDVTRLADVMPKSMAQLRLRELQSDCDRWQVQTAGTKAEVLERLSRLYRGEPVLKKGCTTRYIKLRELKDKFAETAGTKEQARSAEKVRSSGSMAKGTAALATTPSQPEVGCRIFRSYASSSSQGEAAEKMVDPRTGLEIPPGLELGKPVSEITCLVCGCSMAQPFSSAVEISPAPRAVGLPTMWTKVWPHRPRPRSEDSDSNGLRFSPPADGHGFAAGSGEAWLGNSWTEGEPNPFDNDTAHCFQNLFENSFCNMAGPKTGRHNLEEVDGQVNEGRVALLDTACTSCLHSRLWRERYSQTLLAGTKCEETAIRKSFHFANGASTDDKLVVWRVPIYLGGLAGEVFSAEVEQGSTPLLLSIPALDALDSVVHMKDRYVELRALQIEFISKTGHLAVEVAYQPGGPPTSQRPAGNEPPRALSEVADLLVYFAEEASFPLLCQVATPDPSVFAATGGTLVPRGVRPGDNLKELPGRRAQELQRNAGRTRKQDQRTWAAVRRTYSLAEQLCTNGFQDTVVYEPGPEALCGCVWQGGWRGRGRARAGQGAAEGASSRTTMASPASRAEAGYQACP